MPELPEVEVTRRGLEPVFRDAVLQRLQIRCRALRWPVPDGLEARVQGEAVLGVQRRGKYLLIELAPGWLIVHLGMSGSLRIVPAELAPRKHDHVDFVTNLGVARLHDPRRFGALLFHARADGPVEGHPLLAGLGPEPFDPALSAERLASRAYRLTRGRRVAIKQALLAGDLVVGVGNIYASESLFRAAIHPATAAGRISQGRYLRLVEAIRATLGEAISKGGSSLRDFIGVDGTEGYFQIDCFVYDRAGLPCRVCASPIRALRQGQRSTFYCVRCQH